METDILAGTLVVSMLALWVSLFSDTIDPDVIPAVWAMVSALALFVAFGGYLHLTAPSVSPKEGHTD